MALSFFSRRSDFKFLLAGLGTVIAQDYNTSGYSFVIFGQTLEKLAAFGTIDSRYSIS